MKQKIKHLALIMALALSMSLLAGCGNNQTNQSNASNEVSSVTSTVAQADKTKVNVATLKGPTAIGMAQLMDLDDKETAANDYNFTVASAPDDIVGKITTGEIDIAAVPTNLAATLYKKTNGGVKILAVNTLGVLYLVDSTGSVSSVADLKGKTILSSGEGSVPQYVFDYILSKNGIDPKGDVTIEYKAEHSELASLLISGKAQTAVLPEPFVTQVTGKNQQVKVALDLAKEWDTATGGASQLTMGAIIVRSDFLEKNKEAVDQFMKEYEQSTKYANEHVDETAAIVGAKDIMPQEVAKKAIPNCNIVYSAGKEMKDSVSKFYEVLFEAAPKSIGGELPNDEFYYIP